jgi:hypothetical protein
MKRKKTQDSKQASKKTKEEKTTSFINNLPADALAHIFTFLNGFQLCLLRHVSSHFCETLKQCDWLFKKAIIEEQVHKSPLSFEGLGRKFNQELLAPCTDIPALRVKREEIINKEQQCWFKIYSNVMQEQWNFVIESLSPLVGDSARSTRRAKRQLIEQTKHQTMEQIENYEKENGVIIPSIWRILQLAFPRRGIVNIFQSEESKGRGKVTPAMLLLQINQLFESDKTLFSTVEAFGQELQHSHYISKREQDKKWLLCGQYSYDAQSENQREFFMDCDPKSETFGMLAVCRETEFWDIEGGYFLSDWWGEIKVIEALHFSACSVLFE